VIRLQQAKSNFHAICDCVARVSLTLVIRLPLGNLSDIG